MSKFFVILVAAPTLASCGVSSEEAQELVGQDNITFSGSSSESVACTAELENNYSLALHEELVRRDPEGATAYVEVPGYLVMYMHQDYPGETHEDKVRCYSR